MALPQNIRIVARIGDTHSLHYDDITKRRFVRLGASETDPDVMRGTVHTSDINPEDAAEALSMTGLMLFNPETADQARDLDAAYYIRGAIVYEVEHELPGDWTIGVLASIREIPCGGNDFSRDDFAIQYAYDNGTWLDASAAKRLDVALRNAYVDMEAKEGAFVRQQESAAA